jgi:transposase-like protein
MNRRIFKPEFKLQCVLDVISGRKSPTQICREHNISDSVLNKWRRIFMERGSSIFENANSKRSAEYQRISELERLVGKLTLELEASKKLSSYLTPQ